MSPDWTPEPDVLAALEALAHDDPAGWEPVPAPEAEVLPEPDADDAFTDTDEVRLYEHHRVSVDPGQEAIRLDVFLANRIRHLSRSRIKLAAEAGLVRVNGQATKVSYKLKPGEEVTIALPYPPAPDLMPEPIPLNIVHEDDDLIIVNKPAGLVVHPGVGNYHGTLVNGLLYYLKDQLAAPGAEGGIRPGLVHRIDKDTSGLLVVAKQERAFNYLAKQFFDHTTQREYLALVWGNLAEDAGTIVGNIARCEADRKRYEVTSRPGAGKHAVTHYSVVQRYGFLTLVRCRLETGRTHQIRVHFKHLGHTLFADQFYGGLRQLRGKPSRAFQRFMQECFTLLPRQALHARTLGFRHPATEQPIHFSCPLPEDFRLLLLRVTLFTQVNPLPELLQGPIPDEWKPGLEALLEKHQPAVVTQLAESQLLGAA